MRVKIKDRLYTDVLWGEQPERQPFLMAGWYEVVRHFTNGNVLVRVNRAEVTVVQPNEILSREGDYVS